MKKRFTLMMMVLCILMSIPLKMMAESVTVHFIDNNGWTEYDAYVYDNSVKKEISEEHKWPGFHRNYTIETINKQKVVTWTIELGSCTLANARIIFNNRHSSVGNQYPLSGGFEVANNQYYNNDGMTTDPSQGGTGTGSGSGTGGSTGGSTTVEWNTETVNRLTEKPRVYTQGFYLAGNFFSFSDPDKVTYDDAVFKFQQQQNKKIGETDYEIYKVEIPASLTAHAQVMYVNEVGKIADVLGPGSVKKINNVYPLTDTETDWAELSANESTNLLNENLNYWDFSTRNVSATDYSDGMYELYIAFDKKTNTAKWMIKHIQKKRVAYFISTDPSATALPVYDYTKKTSGTEWQYSNQFFATVYFASDRDYYVISNYINKTYISKSPSKYEAIDPNNQIVACPTTNKLFLLGNGGVAFDTNNQHNEFSPNEGPMMGGGTYRGAMTIEYNPNNGNGSGLVVDKHLAMRGQVQVKSGAKDFESVSLVGDPFPGTYTVDESGKNVWDFTSPVADMTYDETEQCYVATVATTVADNGESKFRFVANHTASSNWYEDTTTEPEKKARVDYSKPGLGHTAAANDPNKVSYTKEGKNDPVNDIIWNRPKGTWVVRLYFYTYSLDGVNPKTDYYYTISESKELELRDFENVVYKSLDNKRNILLRGDYKYFRTWSSPKAWKISKDVDIFVVDGMNKNDDGTVSFSLKKISADVNDNVIPSNTGVILATKKTAKDIEGGAVLRERASLTTYNTLVIPMEEYGSTTATTDYDGINKLETLIEAQVVPTKKGNKYNYLFGFYRANKVSDKPYNANDFLLGFWISNGTGAFYSNSAYLPIDEATAKKMNLGVSYNDFNLTTGAKKVPGVLFDFANVGGTTGINEVVNQSTKLNDGKYYTLSGQQVEKPTAGGIYIHNGRKFVVK